MTDTAKASSSSPWRDRESRAFVLRKLFSLTGVVPVAGYTLFHLWKNAAALQGREAYVAMVAEIERLPYLFALEVAVIWIPILFHAVFGLLILLDARYNVGAYRHSRNWMYTLQRVAGVAVLGFLVFHVYELRWQKLMGTMSADGFYDALCQNMSSTVWSIPAVAIVYILGIAAVAFHIANGLWGFLCAWGVTASRRSQRMSATVLGVVGLLVFVLGANTAVYFATGSKLFVPSSAHEGDPTGHCAETVRAVPLPAPAAVPETPPASSQPGAP